MRAPRYNSHIRYNQMIHMGVAVDSALRSWMPLMFGGSPLAGAIVPIHAVRFADANATKHTPFSTTSKSPRTRPCRAPLGGLQGMAVYSFSNAISKLWPSDAQHMYVIVY